VALYQPTHRQPGDKSLAPGAASAAPTHLDAELVEARQALLHQLLRILPAAEVGKVGEEGDYDDAAWGAGLRAMAIGVALWLRRWVSVRIM
jgi:hypothetical protein